MTKEYKTVDAKSDMLVVITPAICKASRPGNPLKCAIVTAVKEQYPMEHFAVFRSTAHGRLKGQNINQRWMLSPTARKFANNFDQYKGTIPVDGLELLLKRPRKHLSQKFLKSKERKASVKASYLNGKNKKKRRNYRLPDALQMAGIRGRFYHA